MSNKTTPPCDKVASKKVGVKARFKGPFVGNPTDTLNRCSAYPELLRQLSQHYLLVTLSTMPPIAAIAFLSNPTVHNHGF